MALYATLEAFRAAFDRADNPELTQLAPSPLGDGPDPARLTAVLTNASALMDEYIGVRYRLPLGVLSAARAAWLGQVCLDLARYLLYADRATEEVRTRYEDHLAYLRQLAGGAIRWPDLSGARATETATPAHAAPAALFDRATLHDY
ncbi:phage protein Gp36 family protein [Thiocystis violascens]|uniref:Mu-like prophage protein gp36 n=1 Tax=Thiocystis violascens (strain ATCC 17096 / DSM 198 / 6111) TaxID=765911 RepID=I3YEI1_THIV6|nr:phage protein Gp36 family protein [Thiocystis violascens]AFL75399.1 Mu-like prophage protein gp36 [Thiocystis violascens DSM 198]